MKKKMFLLLFLSSLGLVTVQAQQELDATTERCLILSSQINDWRAEYFEDAKFNDSVIAAALEGLSICEKESVFEQDFTFRIVEAYVRAKRYDDALEVAQKYHKIIEAFYPFHYNMLYDEVMVVKFHYAGNLEQRNYYIGRMISALEPYIKKHRKRMDFLCRVDDFMGNISKYHKEINLWHYNASYYYLRLLIDPVTTRQEIDKKNYSQEFQDFLKSNGIRCVDFFDCNSTITIE